MTGSASSVDLARHLVYLERRMGAAEVASAEQQMSVLAELDAMRRQTAAILSAVKDLAHRNADS